jgi:uncharacterized DUF497 family protein
MSLPSSADRLVWDDWNREHVAKHGVSPDEAEEVVAGDPIFRAGYKGRLVVTGPTVAGRMLTVVVGPVPHEPSAFYVFSARPASRRERGEYRQQKGGSTP